MLISDNDELKIHLTSGPAKKICQNNAIGKLKTLVCNHTAINCTPACLNKIVAIRLMIGHIKHTIIDEIANNIKIGLSSGDTNLNANAFASFQTKKNSNTKAIGHMIMIS